MAVFLVTLVVCALVPLNPWPFSSWALFSRLRTDQQTGWEAVAVAGSGRARDFPIASLPHGYRGFASIMAEFSERSAVGRDAMCATWLHDATEQFGPSTRLFRIYHEEWLLSNRHGHRAAPRHRTLAWICSRKRRA